MAANRRIERVNRHIQRTLGEIIQRQADLPPEVMVTIAQVKTAPNLAAALVWLHITPARRTATVIKKLQRQIYQLQGSLNQQLKMKPLPRIKFKALPAGSTPAGC